MIPILNDKEISLMKDAGAALKEVFSIVPELITDGISTYELNSEIEKKITSLGATGPCKGYEGFPAMSCISIEDEVIHGIPSMTRRIKTGDIVSVDIVIRLNGYCADAARTYGCGKISAEKQGLIDITEKCFRKAVAKVKDGARLGDIGCACQLTAELSGYGVVRDFCGHGIGKKMHQEPSVLNYGHAGQGVMIKKGMALAIEPMITMKDWRITVDRHDGWTVRTLDHLPAAHFENTVIVTEEGCVITTE